MLQKEDMKRYFILVCELQRDFNLLLCMLSVDCMHMVALRGIQEIALLMITESNGTELSRFKRPVQHHTRNSNTSILLTCDANPRFGLATPRMSLTSLKTC